MDLHLLFAWIWIVTGLAIGAGLGLFFARDDWLGGYGSWPRRMIRLGHIAFIGTGILNLGAHWTMTQLAVEPGTAATLRVLFVAGAVLMPLTCFAAAFRKNLRHAFGLPVATLVAGSATLAFLAANGG